MELRHLRYFVAVAEEGSFTVAAEKRLHTAQPSLSRQMRDLEYEVGTQLLVRSARGVELTPAGHAFLTQARLVLTQTEAAMEAARRAARPEKPSFALGFLTGMEMDWMPAAMQVLRDEMPNIDITISSQISPHLAEGLLRGKLDVAFMRREQRGQDLDYKLIAREPLMIVLPGSHRLASQPKVALNDIVGETFIGMSGTAPVLRSLINDYLDESKLPIRPAHEVDNLAMALSLVSSTHGVVLLPAYARNFLPPTVVSRPVAGDPPVIDLVLGYNRANESRILRLFLSRVDDLIAAADVPPDARTPAF